MQLKWEISRFFTEVDIAKLFSRADSILRRKYELNTSPLAFFLDSELQLDAFWALTAIGFPLPAITLVTEELYGIDVPEEMVQDFADIGVNFAEIRTHNVELVEQFQ